MLYAVVATCPVIGGKVKQLRRRCGDRPARRLEVVPLPDGVAVVADRLARQQAGERWSVIGIQAGGRGTDRRPFRGTTGPRSTGRWRRPRDGSTTTIRDRRPSGEAVYEVPHHAHAPMEPLNCTAQVRDGKVDIWMGTQNPEAALRLAARTAGVRPAGVRP